MNQARRNSAKERRRWVLPMFLLLAAVSVVFYVQLRNASDQQGSELVQENSGDADRQDRFFRFDLSDTTRKAPERLVYPYSVIAGGVASVEELRASLQRDAVAAEHYADFNLTKARVVRLPSDRMAYVSYRKNNAVFWTSKKVRLRKGEPVITDGKNYARTRCANRLSEALQALTSPDEPTEAELDTPAKQQGNPFLLAYHPNSGTLVPDTATLPGGGSSFGSPGRGGGTPGGGRGWTGGGGFLPTGPGNPSSPSNPGAGPSGPVGGFPPDTPSTPSQPPVTPTSPGDNGGGGNPNGGTPPPNNPGGGDSPNAPTGPGPANPPVSPPDQNQPPGGSNPPPAGPAGPSEPAGPLSPAPEAGPTVPASQTPPKQEVPTSPPPIVEEPPSIIPPDESGPPPTSPDTEKVPEPGSLVLMILGLVVYWAYRRRTA
ncbi:MAG: PEP-CTERM sorting domain-containing protein [Acidobacteriota bacterium]